jgi:hypothetical protein
MEDEATGYGISHTSTPRAGDGYDMTSPTRFSELYERRHATVYRAALRVIANPADPKECGAGGETEHPPRNPDHFRQKV